MDIEGARLKIAAGRRSHGREAGRAGFGVRVDVLVGDIPRFPRLPGTLVACVADQRPPS